MKLPFIAVLVAFGGANLTSATTPIESYYVPFPEEMLFNETFEAINTVAEPDVNTLISIAIAANGTYVWYDHWEDGCDSDVTDDDGSTLIWGDEDCSNGCCKGSQCYSGCESGCTNEDDVLLAGQAIVLENTVDILPRNPNNLFFDGGDVIHASFPIAVTRGAFPDQPGSLMAGAVELIKLAEWGDSFQAPVGQNTPSGTNAFQYTVLYVQASCGSTSTEISLNGDSQGSIAPGESMVLRNILQGDTVIANQPVQVNLVTGDVDSTYELRWYALAPTSKWSAEYYTPVGSGDDDEDSRRTRVWCYNPNSSPLTVSYDTATSTGNMVIAPGGTEISGTIPHDSGAHFYSSDDEPFFCITQTESGSQTFGQLYDWGHALIPSNQLTSQALVGWGYGCTANNCAQSTGISTSSRSVVWVTPVADVTTVYVDYNNDGVADNNYLLNALQHVRLTDTDDEDMTGAFIYATDSSGNPVDIAVAWGQDPHLSGSSDDGALDLGTTVPPLPILFAGKFSKLVEDNDYNCLVSVGDILEYTVRIVNIGRVDLPLESFVMEDTLPNHTSYVPGNISTYTDHNEVTTAIPDSSLSGVVLIVEQIGTLPIGQAHEITFRVEVLEGACPTGTIVNAGFVRPDEGVNFAILAFTASDDIDCNDGDDCPSSQPSSAPTSLLTAPGCDCTLDHTYAFNMSEMHGFMCQDPNDMFQLDGHATLVCDKLEGDEYPPGDPLPDEEGGDPQGEIYYSAMYWVMFQCTDGLALAVAGDPCTPLVTTVDEITIGEVCTTVAGDYVEVMIFTSVNGTRVDECCLKETHICNYPMEMVFNTTCWA